MKSLKQHFDELLLEPDKWKYYQNLQCDEKIEDILEKPGKFIEDYLKSADKLPPELSDILRTLSKSKPERLQHTISLFLLGLLLYSKSRKIESNIDSYIGVKKVEVKSLKYGDISIPFNYHWFLICFIHDIGYSLSFDNKEKIITIFGKTEIDKIRRNTKNILKSNPDEDSTPLEIRVSWEAYLKYKKNHKDPNIHEDIDHGLFAGAYFYFTLKKIYEQKKELNGNEEEFIDIKTKLFWSEKMLNNVHKPIAWIIAAHNIWFKNINCDDINEYKEANLGKLIIDEPLITLEKYPLYFLLCLVDSLDPVKYLSKDLEIDINTKLKNTYLGINKADEVRLEFRNELKKFNLLYKCEISSLPNWLDVTSKTIITISK